MSSDPAITSEHRSFFATHHQFTENEGWREFDSKENERAAKWQVSEYIYKYI